MTCPTRTPSASPLVEKLGDAQVPWSMWSYKAILPHSSPDNVWGMVRNEGDAATLDVRRDSEAELRRKMAPAHRAPQAPCRGPSPSSRTRPPGPARSPAPPTQPAFSNLAVRVQDAFWSTVIGVGDRLRGLFGGRI